MSAQEELEVNLVLGAGMLLQAANALLDAYAHELAERIRAVGIDGWEGMSDVAKTIRQTRAACADLIDPEVSHDGA